MFKINPFYHIEFRRRIHNYMTLKIKVKVILNKLLNELHVLASNYEYVSLRVGLSAILHDMEFTYHCPFASTVGYWHR